MRRKSARQNNENWKKCNMMMNCFWVMVDRRKAISLISSQHNCQRFSASLIFHTPQLEYEPVQNLGPEFVEWSSILLITSTQECHKWENRQECNMKRMQHEKSATWKKYNIKKSVTWKECNIILVQHKAAQHKNRAT